MTDLRRTFLACAEDDYRSLLRCYNEGAVSNQMGVLAQEVCEKYLKHLISEFVLPRNEAEVAEKKLVLDNEAHSSKALVPFLEEKLGLWLPRDLVEHIESLDSYFGDSWVPRENDFLLNKDDIARCFMTATLCRDYALELTEMKLDAVLEIAKGIAEGHGVKTPSRDGVHWEISG